ncbi:cytidine monophosphate (UMP-CMP) kinase 1, cytosolic [Saguinus oedipus]|uniref:Cytidine monophosphate (UMP-CMP) kinase 1, cytosolic n=1 Tax=Saguinus oedipus TaxID=9490 RepID=A0ABQ9VGF0_SAGOE|nr:cytidine monophosphate (UMP-CMP) kinase 1, cytosolic [Saguinus oedipus]
MLSTRVEHPASREFQKYGYTHLSAGELLRDERKNPDSQYGELIEKYIKEGKIVPVEITISLLKRALNKYMLNEYNIDVPSSHIFHYHNCGRKAIAEAQKHSEVLRISKKKIDARIKKNNSQIKGSWVLTAIVLEEPGKFEHGEYRIFVLLNYMNSRVELEEMDQTMAANAQKNKFLIDGFPRNQDNLQGWNKTMDGKADVSFVLFFDCNNEICIERCLERGKSSGRSDDNRESLEKRIQTYLQSTKPIIDLYEEMGKVKKIDASKSVDEVFDEVVKIFDKEG